MPGMDRACAFLSSMALKGRGAVTHVRVTCLYNVKTMGLDTGAPGSSGNEVELKLELGNSSTDGRECRRGPPPTPWSAATRLWTSMPSGERTYDAR